MRVKKNVKAKGVPVFEATEIKQRNNKYCLAVFVINEGQRIKKQLKKLQKYSKMIDIIISDGGSTDGSLNINVLKKRNVNTLLVKKDQGGLSSQMRMAFFYAIKKGYKGVVVMDGNNKDNPNSIPHFIKCLDEGFDHIQGSRYIKGGKGKNTPVLRHVGVKLIHAPLISMAAGFHYTDTTNGFRAYSKNLLIDKRVQPLRKEFNKYELHYYLAIKAAKLGYKIKEIPVKRSYPKHKVPTKISGLKGNMAIIKTLFDVITGKYNLKK